MKNFLAYMLIVLGASGALVAPFVGTNEVALRRDFLIISNQVQSISSTGGITAATATNIANAAVGPALTWRTKPIYYVDSVNGLNTRSGTNEVNAWKTNIFQKLTNALGTITINNVDLRLARGSVWRESLPLGSNCSVRAYGAGPEPILNGADVVTNWFKVGTFTNSWAVTNFTVTGGGSTTWMNVVEDGRQLRYYTNVVNVDATPGTYTIIGGPANVTSGSATQIVIIHPRGSTAPTNDGKIYEITKRNVVIEATDDFELRDVVTLNAMQEGGSCKALLRANIENLTALNGNKHNAFFSSGIIRNSKFKYQEYGLQSASLAVHYNDVDGLKIRYERCFFSGYPDSPAAASSILGHTSANGYGQVDFVDCVMEYCQDPGVAGTSATGEANWVRCKALGMTIAGWTVYNGTNNYIDCEFMTVPTIEFPPNGSVVNIHSSNTRTWISGMQSANTPYGVFINTDLATNYVTVHRSFMHGVGSGFYFLGYSNFLILSNTIIRHISPYNLGASNVISAAGSNVFVTGMSATVDGVTYGTFGAYLAAFPALDIGTKTNDMQLTGDPAFGSFEYASTSPAVDNQAGPGWIESPRPIRSGSLDSILAYTLPRLSSGLNIDFSAIGNKLNRTRDTASVFTVTGSWTNQAANTIDIQGQSSLNVLLQKSATNNDAMLSFFQGGTNDFTIGLPAGGDYGAIIETKSFNPLRVRANNNTLSLGGGGATPIRFEDNTGALFGLFDANGDLGIGTNNPAKRLSVNGGVQLRNLDASNAAPVAAAVFDANGNLTHGALGAAGVSSGIFQDGTTNLVDSGSSGKFITRNNSGSVSGVYTNVYEFGNDLSASDTRLSFWEVMKVDLIAFGMHAWDHTAEEMQAVYSYTNTTSLDLFQFWKPVDFQAGLTANSLTVDTFTTSRLVVESNVNEFAAGAYHGIDLNFGSEWVGTNSLAGNTILSYTNFHKWTNNAFNVYLEGAIATGTDHIVTNIFGGAIGSVPTLLRVNGAANTESPLVLTVTNGTTLELDGKVKFSRGTNFMDLLVKWGTR